MQYIVDIFFYVLFYDLWFYFSHVVMHKVEPLRKIHMSHHTVFYKQMTFSDAYTGHFIETPLQSLGILFPLLFKDFVWCPLIVSVVFVNARNMVRHNYKTIGFFGNHHIIHHKYYYCNFGEYWIDRLFQTHYKGLEEEPVSS
jgi:sterol desaturase/sphingolipid hydroxylase (fatty acid hydroxylase superfamily)